MELLPADLAHPHLLAILAVFVEEVFLALSEGGEDPTLIVLFAEVLQLVQ